MKTRLLLRRALTDGVSLYTPERDFTHGALNVAGATALLGRILNRRHSIGPVVCDLSIPSVNNELASFFRFDDFPRGLDRPHLE